MRKENELEIDKSHMDELMELLEGEVFYGSFLGCQAEVWAIKDEMPDFGAGLKKKSGWRRFYHAPLHPYGGRKVPVFSERRNDPPGR